MRGFLVVLLSLSALCAQAAPSDEWLVVGERLEGVVCCSFRGDPDIALAAQNIHLVFTPSEVVHVIKRDGNKFLVRGYSGNLSAWINNPKLVAPTSFRALNTWNGQSHFEISSASFDSGQVYEFAKDGTFSASFDDNHEPRKWSGRLHRYKQIIWAKPYGAKVDFDAWSVFQLKKDGTVCILYFDSPPGAQCVGSME